MSEEIANLSAFSVFVPLSLARTLQKKKQKSAQSLKYLIDVVN